MECEHFIGVGSYWSLLFRNKSTTSHMVTLALASWDIARTATWYQGPRLVLHTWRMLLNAVFAYHRRFFERWVVSRRQFQNICGIVGLALGWILSAITYYFYNSIFFQQNFVEIFCWNKIPAKVSIFQQKRGMFSTKTYMKC